MMIELINLQKVIEQRTMIEIPALKVEDGEIAALVGPAGSGKEALLDLLLGRARPTVGEVNLAGLKPGKDGEALSRHVGVLFFEDGLYTRQTVRSNLNFQCQLYGVNKNCADEVLTRVGLTDHSSVRVDKLPSGLARRLAFGRASLHNPQVMLLVEPFARCDDASITLLSGQMQKMADDGCTILVLANDTAFLPTLCDTIHVLDQGRLVDSYQPQEAQQSQLPFKVPVRLEGKVALVNPADILYAEVEDGRAYLQTSEGRLPTQFTLSELEERLARSGFFRAHRAYLVNLQHVREVIPFTRNSFSLRLNDPNATEIPLSKSAAGELKDLLGY